MSEPSQALAVNPSHFESDFAAISETWKHIQTALARGLGRNDEVIRLVEQRLIERAADLRPK